MTSYVSADLAGTCYLRLKCYAGSRDLLQSGLSAVNTGPTSFLPDLTAVQAVALLCARNITAVDYVTALNTRYVSGGYSCNNPWITYNITQVQQAFPSLGADSNDLCIQRHRQCLGMHRHCKMLLLLMQRRPMAQVSCHYADCR